MGVKEQPKANPICSVAMGGKGKRLKRKESGHAPLIVCNAKKLESRQVSLG